VPSREIYATIDCIDDGENGFPRIAANIAKLPELLSRHKTWGVR